MKLNEAIHWFLSQKSVGSQRTYKADLTWLIRYLGEETDIYRITQFDLFRAVEQYRQRETVTSDYTVNKFIKTMRTFFNWCVKVLDDFTKSPARHVALLELPTNDTYKRTMPDDVYDALLEHYRKQANTKSPRQKAHVRMYALLHFLGTSARAGGAAGLQWKHIDFAECEAIVTEKGGKTRDVFLSSDCIAALRQWRAFQKNFESEGDYVFSEKGGHIGTRPLGKFFRDYCHKAGFDRGWDETKNRFVKGWGTHSVRHNVGVNLQDHLNENDAAAIMGHSVETYRKHYAATDKQRIKERALEVAKKRENLRKKVKKAPTFDKSDAS